jgi:O-antigen biosynthesis protein
LVNNTLGEQMIYLILGMHKSGTTLVSQIMHHSGINMGDDIPVDISYDKGNKYERQSCLHLNMDILNIDNYSVLDTIQPQGSILTDKQKKQMNKIIQDCTDNYGTWGFKDPRTPLVLSYWKDILPEHKIIAVYRHPGEIWPRFTWIGLKRFYKNPLRALKLIKRWSEHNANIIDYIKNSEADYLMLSYQELMTSDTEFKRLEDFLGIKLNDRRNKSLFRSKNRDWKLIEIADSLLGIINGRYIKDIMMDLKDLRKKQL